MERSPFLKALLSNIWGAVGSACMGTSLMLLVMSFTSSEARAGEGRYPDHVKTDAQKKAWDIGWPQWGGPFGNKSGVDCGYTLIDDLKNARLVWQSEAATPPTDSSKGYRGGFASPMMEGGRVVLFYYTGGGDVIDEKLRAYLLRKKAKTGLDDADIERISKVSADEIILCVDAGTGKTLWKAVHEDAGYNDQTKSAKNGGHFTPAIRYGRVVAAGTTGRVYCHDAETGKELWQANTGASHQSLEAMKAEAIKAGRHLSSRNNKVGLSNGAPLISSGVAIVLDGANKMHGFALDTGKKLWETKGLGSGKRNSAIGQIWWRGEGEQEYILYAGKEVFCIDPRDGSIKWSLTGHEGGNNVVASPTHMIVDGIGDREAKQVIREDKDGSWQTVTEQVYGPCIYRITPEGAKLVKRFDVSFMIKGLGSPAIYKGQAFWSTEWVFGRHNPDNPTFIASVDLETGKLLGKVTSKDTGYEIAQVYQAVLAEGRYLHTTGYDHGWFATDPLKFLSHNKFEIPKMGQDTSAIYACGYLIVRGVDSLRCYDLRAKSVRPLDESER